MIEINDIRKNSKILIDSAPYTVVDFQHVKPGKGNAFTRCRLKNLQTGQQLERTFKSNEKFDEPNMEYKEMQFLFSDGSMLHFMDTTNYEQIAHCPFMYEELAVQAEAVETGGV
jgi:elongation factor P